MSFGRLCRWRFGGTECNVDSLADLSGNTGILHVVGTSERYRSAVTYFFDSGLTHAADFWNYGRLECLVAGTSVERRVVDFSGGTIEFDVPFSTAISSGTKYHLWAGCPKTLTACSAVSPWGPSSGNTVNYGGFLYVSKKGNWRPQEG